MMFLKGKRRADFNERIEQPGATRALPGGASVRTVMNSAAGRMKNR